MSSASESVATWSCDHPALAGCSHLRSLVSGSGTDFTAVEDGRCGAAASPSGSPLSVVRTVAELRQRLILARRAGARVGFVPTMGYLHAGHVALMRRARAEVDVVVASVFVNPTQFGAAEDFGSYPVDLDGDIAQAVGAGVDLLFVPSVQEMYPSGVATNTTWVEVSGISEGLCGRHRPGHFRGVATVVSRLFLMVQPDVAYFGEKDFQQLAVIRRMVRDLAFPVEVVGVATVREADGLAMSSRNSYLSATARGQATCLIHGLRQAQRLYQLGERRRSVLLEAATAMAEVTPLATVQYAELVDAESLAPQGEVVSGACVLALAVYVDGTRLIDNVRLDWPTI